MATQRAYQIGSAAQADYLKQLQAQADAESAARFKADQEEAQRVAAIEAQAREAEANRQGALSREADISRGVADRFRSGLFENLQNLYGGVRDAGVANIDKNYGDRRKKLIAEENALGRLQSPISIPTISGLDDARSSDIANLEGQIAGQQAGQQANIYQTIENLLQGENQFNKNLSQQESEFGRNLASGEGQFDKTFGLQNKQFEANKNLSERQFDLDRWKYGNDLSLGIQGIQQQNIANARASDDRKPGMLDYLDTAFKGLGAVSGAFAGGGGGGSLASSLGGLLKKKKPVVTAGI